MGALGHGVSRPLEDALAAPPPLGLRMAACLRLRAGVASLGCWCLRCAGLSRPRGGAAYVRAPRPRGAPGAPVGQQMAPSRSRNLFEAATGGVSGWPSSHATPISRTALGAATVSSTTPGRASAGGGRRATPRPAATRPRAGFGLLALEGDAGLETGLRQSSVMGRMPNWGSRVTRLSAASARRMRLRAARRWSARTMSRSFCSSRRPTRSGASGTGEVRHRSSPPATSSRLAGLETGSSDPWAIARGEGADQAGRSPATACRKPKATLPVAGSASARTSSAARSISARARSTEERNDMARGEGDRAAPRANRSTPRSVRAGPWPATAARPGHPHSPRGAR